MTEVRATDGDCNGPTRADVRHKAHSRSVRSRVLDEIDRFGFSRSVEDRRERSRDHGDKRQSTELCYAEYLVHWIPSLYTSRRYSSPFNLK